MSPGPSVSQELRRKLAECGLCVIYEPGVRGQGFGVILGMSLDASVLLFQRSGESFVETKHEARKMPKFLYTREFLLSLSELDVCKKLPIGFDSSILSEFEDASSSALERQRTLGSSLQGPRRSDYGSTSLKRVDGTGSYSRVSHGRWDTHSTGSSDKDGESHSDRDSQDSGGHYVNQSRRTRQNPERDGLLGSGAFPRPSGHQGRASAPKAGGNGHHQLNKCSERYQPPRPYKATPYSWRESTDSYNDETFGSSECSSEERAEEEKKRRASFELMRKEQQKALQENQKQTSDKRKENLDNDIIALLEKSKVDKNLKNNRDEGNLAVLASESDSAKYSFHGNFPASRPSVPPGFASAITEKNLGSQPLNRTLGSEVGIMGKNPLLTKDTLVVNGGESDLERGHDSAADARSDRNINKSNGIASSSEDATDHPLADLGPEGCSLSGCDLLGADRGWENVTNSSSRREVVPSDGSEQNHSASILDKLLDSTTKDDGDLSRSTEHQGATIDEQTWSPTFAQSSKYTHWFLEDKKPAEDLSSRELLSLIIKNKTGSGTSIITHEHVHPVFPSGNSETGQEFSTSTATSSISGVHELYGHQGKPDTNSGMLTCEDLEQSILAEVKESSSYLPHTTEGPWNPTDANSELQKADVDDNASQHLLSLLHKGTSSSDLSSLLNPKLTHSLEGAGGMNVESEVTVMFTGNKGPEKAETVDGTEKSLTLEALFGSSFMKELHSMEAPVSGHKGSIGDHIDTSAAHNQIMFPNANYISSSSELGLNIPLEENMALKHTQETRPQTYQESWRGFGVSQTQNSVPANNIALEEGFSEIRLPEEENLITVGDTMHPITADPFPAENAPRTVELLRARRPDEVLMDKLAALSTTRSSDRYTANDLDTLSAHGPYHHMVEPGLSYQHLHGRPPSPQFSYPHMDHLRSSFQPFDGPTHRNHLMKFVGPENIHHDASHRFPSVHHHPFHSPGGPMLDPAIHLSMASPMSMRGNFPPHQLLQGFPRGVPLPHPPNHMPAYMPEMNTVHGFHQQPSYGSFGMGMPGTSSSGPGGGDPESLRRMMEMRTNLKQTHLSAHSHLPGVYSPELDMGFR